MPFNCYASFDQETSRRVEKDKDMSEKETESGTEKEAELRQGVRETLDELSRESMADGSFEKTIDLPSAMRWECTLPTFF